MSLAWLHPRQDIQMASLSLLLVAILLAGAQVVEPLVCPTCIPSSSTCPNKTCDSGQDTCMSLSILQTLKIGETQTNGYSQYCAVAKENVNSSFRFEFGEDKSLEYSSLLCKGPCSVAPPFAHINLEDYLNGKFCPRCYRPGNTSCEDNGTVACYGDFIQCAAISGKIIEGGFEIPFAAKGCARGNMEELSSKLSLRIVTFEYNYTLDTLSYGPANGALAAMRRFVFSLNSKDLGPQVAFFFPCFLGLFAVKIFS
ncbi:phospholipase A2 inhibitor and Ly6/PLAUR domain-containing protein-like [Anolis sagrei]|uniref:phospholipase A2 inhibitor and Ly6/PLAUR domain-containing protein-like n=1 Tax=Anolis sagrei TaxID=38937 RepID=UPI0035226EF1